METTSNPRSSSDLELSDETKFLISTLTEMGFAESDARLCVQSGKCSSVEDAISYLTGGGQDVSRKSVHRVC